MKRLQTIDELNIGHGSHEGMSGKDNEDSYGVFAWRMDDGQVINLGVVADGVGGQIAGEVASRLTIQAVGNYFDSQEQVNNVSGHLEQSIRAANESVYEASQTNEEYRGMASTIAMVAVIDGHMYTAHVGDSRIYLWRGGQLRQLSIDHTWAQEAIEAGLLTREQAKVHPNRNVIKRHLGGRRELKVDHRLMLSDGLTAEQAQEKQGSTMQPGDLVLICSDGLTDMIDDTEVQASLQTHGHRLDVAVQELIDKANRAGGRDNITVVLMQMPENGTAPTMVVTPPAVTAVGADSPATVISAAPQAPPEAAVAAAPAAAAAPRQKSRSRWGLPLLLVLLAGLVMIAVVAVGGYILLSSDAQETPTATPTSEAPLATATPGVVTTAGAPATAAILDTEGDPTTTMTLAPDETPGVIPTLRATSTNTPRPVLPTPEPPTATATSEISETATATATNGPPPPPASTNTPVPPTATNTPVPPTATNTPEPPTATNTPIPQATIGPGG